MQGASEAQASRERRRRAGGERRREVHERGRRPPRRGEGRAEGATAKAHEVLARCSRSALRSRGEAHASEGASPPERTRARAQRRGRGQGVPESERRGRRQGAPRRARASVTEGRHERGEGRRDRTPPQRGAPHSHP